eukprot:GGOE01014085.1.p1 GENE.GGOE01014085.1~~GGOE01014085.1.p1  ORF type:complete len:417 (-),score=67.82 GGOE01014085.1:94-1344(-)
MVRTKGSKIGKAHDEESLSKTISKLWAHAHKELYAKWCVVVNVGGQPHWQLYFDVLRDLQEVGDGKAVPSLTSLNQRMDKIYMQYIKHSCRPANLLDREMEIGNRKYFKYDDVWNRLAYFMFRVPKHSGIVWRSLEMCHRQIYPILCEAAVMGRPLVVTSCGGGPGSDFFGLLTYLDKVGWFCRHKRQKTPRLVFHTLDLSSWRHIWEEIQQSLDGYYDGVEVHYHITDLTCKGAAKQVPPETDIMLFSYFMVEMTPFENRFLEFFTALVNIVKPGTLFLALDLKSVGVTKLKTALFTSLQSSLDMVLVRMVLDKYPCPVFQAKGKGTREVFWLEMVLKSELHAWRKILGPRQARRFRRFGCWRCTAWSVARGRIVCILALMAALWFLVALIRLLGTAHQLWFPPSTLGNDSVEVA